MASDRAETVVVNVRAVGGTEAVGFVAATAACRRSERTAARTMVEEMKVMRETDERWNEIKTS